MEIWTTLLFLKVFYQADRKESRAKEMKTCHVPQILASSPCLCCFSYFLSLSNIRSSKVERQWKKLYFSKIYQRPYLSPCFLTLTHIQEFGYKVRAWVFWQCLDRIWTAHTCTHIHTNTHAMCASMWRCLDGVRAAYLSVCDRLTAQAPSTLSTIITSRNTHTHTRTSHI